MLFAHGDPVTHFYLVISGTVQLFRTNPDGHEKTIAVVKTGQTLCEDEIMNSCHGHRVNGVAVEDTAVLEFPITWLKETAKKYSTFALNLLSLIAARASGRGRSRASGHHVSSAIGRLFHAEVMRAL